MKTWVLGFTLGIFQVDLFTDVSTCYFSLWCISFPKLCKSHYNLLCGHCIIVQFGTFALFDAGICMRILLLPSMPHTRNTRRVKKPLPHIFYNTIGHPFPHCIYMVPQFDFFSLIKGVFPEPTLTQCPPVHLVNLLRLHMNLNMSFPIVKVLVTVGCDTWHLLEINTHFNLVPSCISYCGDKVNRVKKKTFKAKAQLNGHEVWYDCTTGTSCLHFVLDNFYVNFSCLLWVVAYRNFRTAE